MDDPQPGPLHSIVERLMAHSVRYNLTARAMDSCRAWWVAEPPEEMPYPLDALRMEFAAHKLCFHNARLPYPYIETHLRLFVGHREVGDYRLITLSDGRVDDDYLIFE